MKKTSLLNAPVSEIIASMGHGQRLLICDSGLPVPYDAIKVDLAVTANIPRFIDVLKAVLDELEVEKMIIAEEFKKHNGEVYNGTKELLPDVSVQFLTHEAFKDLVKNDPDIFIVRTGEATPYANIILQSGVTF